MVVLSVRGCAARMLTCLEGVEDTSFLPSSLAPCPQTLKRIHSFIPVTPLLGIFPKETNLLSQYFFARMFITLLFIKVKIWKIITSMFNLENEYTGLWSTPWD